MIDPCLFFGLFDGLFNSIYRLIYIGYNAADHTVRYGFAHTQDFQFSEVILAPGYGANFCGPNV